MSESHPGSCLEVQGWPVCVCSWSSDLEMRRKAKGTRQMKLKGSEAADRRCTIRPSEGMRACSGKPTEQREELRVIPNLERSLWRDLRAELLLTWGKDKVTMAWTKSWRMIRNI